MLANVSAPLLGLVDIGLMGHQPDSHYLAAVTIGANLFAVVAWGFNFLTMATSGSTAWVFGRSGVAGAVAWLRRLVPLTFGLGILLLLASSLLIPLGLAFYAPPAELASGAQEYLHIRRWSAPLILMNLLLAGWFVGIQHTRVNLWATVCAQVVNILLSVFFVYVLQLGITGVALGSVFGDAAAFIIYGYTAYHQFIKHKNTDYAQVIPKLMHYIGLAGSLILRTLTLLFAFNYFNRLSLSFGTEVLAANAVLLSFLLVVSALLDAFANAAEALVGEAKGAHQRSAVQDAILATGVWSAAAALALCAIFLGIHQPAIALLTDLPDIRLLANQYAIWMITLPLYTWWAYWLDGVFIGLQWVKAMRNILLISVFAVFLPLSWLLPLPNNHAIWALFALMMLVRSALMVAWLRQRWSAVT